MHLRPKFKKKLAPVEHNKMQDLISHKTNIMG